MKTKLELAHEWYMKNCREGYILHKNINNAWKYADAMYAELEKRESKDRPTVLQEWQPDWSEAPEWAKWWAMDEIGTTWWCKEKPFMLEYQWCFVNSFRGASLFGYTGDWKDSLRERTND